MTTQVLNFLWLNLDIPAPPDPANGDIRQPMPKNYIANIREAGAAHPQADIVLWVDSKRLTERQMDHLRNAVENGDNIHVKDLRGIPAYNQTPLYNEPETNPNWRDADQRSVIWRQVDAAKALICLQGNYDQTFVADLDHAHLDLNEPQVQEALGKHGLFIGSREKTTVDIGQIENQLWGFERSKRPFFELACAMALKSCTHDTNAWYDFVMLVKSELLDKEKIPMQEFCLALDSDGSQAEHPEHKWREGVPVTRTALWEHLFSRPPHNKKGLPPENGSRYSSKKFAAKPDKRRRANRCGNLPPPRVLPLQNNTAYFFFFSSFVLIPSSSAQD